MEAKKRRLFQCMESLLKDITPSIEQRLNDNYVPFKCDHDHGKMQSVFARRIDQFITTAEKTDLVNPLMEIGEKHEIETCSCSLMHQQTLFRVSYTVICDGDYRWKFMTYCLKMLLLLGDLLTTETTTPQVKIQNKHKHAPNLLSVSDEKLIGSILQLISTFGLWPHFLNGIGRPLSTKLDSTIIPVKRYDRRQHFTITRVIFLLTKDKNILNALIMSNLCSDILASLIQLGYEPKRGKDDRDIELCAHEICWCRNRLEDFLARSYQPLVVKELLVLQRVAGSSRQPKWFVKRVGNLLSKCMIVSQGVKNVVEAILDGLPDSLSWKHYDSIGQTISRVPLQASNRNEYYSIISPQILDLLAVQHGNEAFIHVCTSVVVHMTEKDFECTNDYVMCPMMRPLLEFTGRDLLVLNEKDVVRSIQIVRKLLCTNATILPERLFDSIARILHPLFLAYCISIEPFPSLRNQVKDILLVLLEKLSKESAIQAILTFVLWHSKSRDTDMTKDIVRESMTVVFPAKQEVNITTLNDQQSRDLSYPIGDVSLVERINSVVSILKAKELEALRGDIFVMTLKEFVSNTISTDNKEDKETRGKELLQIDEVLRKLKFNIELVSFMSALIDTFGHDILQNTPQIISFIKAILEWSQDTERCDQDLTSGFYEQTLNMVLMLLSTLLPHGELTPADYGILQQLIPLLERTSNTHTDASTRAMAVDLMVFITTHGSLVPKATTATTIQGNQNGRPSCEKQDLQSEECYQQAIDQLSDPLLPTRGHALRVLSTLLKKRNQYAVRNEEQLFTIFEMYLKHEDTYLYLAAVDGLIALVDVQHRTVMPMLCKKFIEMRTDVFNEVASHNRMKLCEAIIRSCSLCGEVLPVYKDLLISALLCGVKDEDELIRASSLSGIGELCRLLKYSIGSIITEVFDCIRCVISTDKSNEARRASVQVVSQILKGVDEALFQMIPDNLRDIYRLLKMVKLTETDDVTLLHADNALTILEENIAESFRDVAARRNARMVVM